MQFDQLKRREVITLLGAAESRSNKELISLPATRSRASAAKLINLRQWRDRHMQVGRR
jgi:hypothetical protein